MSKKSIFLIKNGKKRHFWPFWPGDLLGGSGPGPGPDPKTRDRVRPPQKPPKRGGSQKPVLYEYERGGSDVGGPIYLVTKWQSGGSRFRTRTPVLGSLAIFGCFLRFFCIFLNFWTFFTQKLKNSKREFCLHPSSIRDHPKNFLLTSRPHLICASIFALFLSYFWLFFLVPFRGCFFYSFL